MAIRLNEVKTCPVFCLVALYKSVPPIFVSLRMFYFVDDNRGFDSNDEYSTIGRSCVNRTKSTYRKNSSNCPGSRRARKVLAFREP